MQEKNFRELQPRVVLGVAAHPDDLEFSAGGSVAKWADQGTEVHYLILTDSSKGTSNRKQTPEQVTAERRKEQQAAAKVLGVKSVEFLNYEDGALECTRELRRDIVKTIRRLKPDVVVSLDPSYFYSAGYGFMNHPDHRAAGEATLDAVYPLARNHMSFPELLEGGLDIHFVETVLLVNFDRHNYCVDVSGTIDTKLQALAVHASQYDDPTQIQTIARSFAESVGAENGCQCAEAFMRIDLA